MRIQVISRKGHYNILNPAQESISTHIAIFDDNGNKTMYCNISTEDFSDAEDLSYLVDEMKDYLNRTITSDKKQIENIIKFIEDNEQELEIGNRCFKLEALIKKRNRLNDEIEELRKKIGK